MRKLIPKLAGILLAWLFALFSGASLAEASAAQNLLDQKVVSVDSFQIDGIPVIVSNASLTGTEKGYTLKLFASNSSNERILGARYLMIVVDSSNGVRSVVDRSEDLKLGAYSARQVTLSTPFSLKIASDDRVFLVMAQAIGRESIWEASKAREALEAYAKGEVFKMPNVWCLPNQVDSPPRWFSRIY